MVLLGPFFDIINLMLVNVLLLIIGFFVLVKGADFFVDAAVSLSKKFNVPPIIIGLTVVAFGTSAPEFFISFMAALNGTGDITLGNVIGSNLANILLILGIASLIMPLSASAKVIVREVPFMFLTAMALWFIADDSLFGGSVSSSFITRGDAFVLLLLFSIFLYYLITEALKSQKDKKLQAEFKEAESATVIRTNSAISFALLVGLIMLGVGGKFVVDSSVDIASSFGISQALVGLTIVAIGSSLPELVTTIIAVRKKESDVAIGNIVGSNIFNTIFIVGVAGAITPLAFNNVLRIDIIVMILASILLFFAVLTGKRINRVEGLLFLLVYVFYTAYIVLRG